MIGEIVADRRSRRTDHPQNGRESKSENSSTNNSEHHGTELRSHRGNHFRSTSDGDVNSSVEKQHDALVALGLYDDCDDEKDMV